MHIVRGVKVPILEHGCVTLLLSVFSSLLNICIIFFIWHLHFYLDLLTHAHLLLWVIINKIIWTFSWNWVTIVWSISLFFVWHEKCMYKNWVASAKQNITVIHTTWKRNGEKYYCFIDLVVDKKYWFKKNEKKNCMNVYPMVKVLEFLRWHKW